MERISVARCPVAACIRGIRHLFAALALFAGAPVAGAGELSLLINGVAKHTDVPAGTHYNERNTGVGLQYDYDRTENNWVPFLTAAGFKDSEYNMSYYAGGGVMRRFDIAPKFDNLYVGVGAVGFVMTRKTFKNNDPFLGALPAATVGTAHVAVNISYVPKVHPKLVPLWFFQLKIPFATY